MIVVDKPAGLVVHPGAGNPDGTLVNGLLARYPELAEIGESHRPGIVHRLDIGTSGLMVVARSVARVRRAGRTRSRSATSTRLYRTLVWGHLGNPNGVIDAPDRPRPSRSDADGCRRRRASRRARATRSSPSTRDPAEASAVGVPPRVRAHAPDQGPPRGDRSSGGGRRHVRRDPARDRDAAAVPARRRTALHPPEHQRADVVHLAVARRPRRRSRLSSRCSEAVLERGLPAMGRHREQHLQRTAG